MQTLDRRSVVAGLAAAICAGTTGTAKAAPALADLALFGPPAGPSITLAHAVASGAFEGIAEKASFSAWRNPDELRAGLTSGSMQVAVMPTQAAANLYNRGLGVRLINVMTNGLLYVVSADRSIDGIAALKGKTIVVPFRNDTPDLIFRRLLAENGLEPGADLKLENAGTPVEAIQLLISGRVDAALVPEPAATAAIVQAGKAGTEIQRVVDIQKAWGAATGGAPVLPQAGLAVTDAFLDKNGDVLAAIQAAITEATRSVNDDPQTAARDAAEALGMPQPILAKSIPTSNLVSIPAKDARASLEAMYRTVSEVDAGIIGGKLPDAAFYL